MDWNDGPGTVTAVVAVLALVGSFLSFARSLGAEKKAAAAEKRAESAEQDANEARTRAAAALERANEIAEQQLVPPYVAWGEFEHVSEHRWLVKNVGTVAAVHARFDLVDYGVHIEPDDPKPRRIEPGASIGVTFIRGGLPAPGPVISWIDPDGTPKSQQLYF